MEEITHSPYLITNPLSKGENVDLSPDEWICQSQMQQSTEALARNLSPLFVAKKLFYLTKLLSYLTEINAFECNISLSLIMERKKSVKSN